MAEVEPAVVVVESEEEPFPAFELTEHPLLDVPYQHAPETAGLDYAGELEDEVVVDPKKS
jgi:hypothetical protein